MNPSGCLLEDREVYQSSSVSSQAWNSSVRFKYIYEKLYEESATYLPRRSLSRLDLPWTRPNVVINIYPLPPSAAGMRP